MRAALYSQIRGLLKTFGVVLAPGKGGSFEQLALRDVPKDHYVEVVIQSLLSTWRHLSTEMKKLNREVERAARAITRVPSPDDGTRSGPRLRMRTPLMSLIAFADRTTLVPI